MLARVESRAREKGCRTSAPIVREGIVAPDPEKAGASPLLAGCVPVDDLRCEPQACFRFRPRDLDRGQESREHQHVAGRFRHRGKDHVLVIGTFDHADAAAGVVAEAGEPRRCEAECTARGAAAAEARRAAAERVRNRNKAHEDFQRHAPVDATGVTLGRRRARDHPVGTGTRPAFRRTVRRTVESSALDHRQGDRRRRDKR